jgi:hypothetical protein
MHLMGGDAFLASANQEGSHKPLVERKVRALEQRSGHDRELLAALTFVALIEARAALKSRGVIHGAAMATYRLIGPQMIL